MYRRDAIRFQGLDAILGGWMAQIASIVCGYEISPVGFIRIASIACDYEISPVGFTRRSRVYRGDAIRFQGFVEIERTSLIFDYY